MAARVPEVSIQADGVSRDWRSFKGGGVREH